MGLAWEMRDLTPHSCAVKERSGKNKLITFYVAMSKNAAILVIVIFLPYVYNAANTRLSRAWPCSVFLMSCHIP